MIKQAHEKILTEIYYDPKTGYIGQNKLYQKVKAIDPSITRNIVIEWIKTQDSIQTQNKNPVQTQKKYQKKIVGGHNSYQCDLTFYSKFKRQNKGYWVILTVIEMNTRKAYARPLKNKETKTVLDAFKDILKELPEDMDRIESDNGSEFINKQFQKMIDDEEIIHLTFDAENHRALGVVERFNGTLREKIGAYMNANNTVKWIDVLDDLVENYNDTEHSGIHNRKPKDLDWTDEHEIIGLALEHNKKVDDLRTKVANIEIGDIVKRKVARGAFTKGGTNAYSAKTYKVLGRDGDKYDIGLKQSIPWRNLLKVNDNQTTTEPREVDKAIRLDRSKRLLNKEDIVDGARPKTIPGTTRNKETTRVAKRTGIDKSNILTTKRR